MGWRLVAATSIKLPSAPTSALQRWQSFDLLNSALKTGRSPIEKKLSDGVIGQTVCENSGLSKT